MCRTPLIFTLKLQGMSVFAVNSREDVKDCVVSHTDMNILLGCSGVTARQHDSHINQEPYQAGRRSWAAADCSCRAAVTLPAGDMQQPRLSAICVCISAQTKQRFRFVYIFCIFNTWKPNTVTGTSSVLSVLQDTKTSLSKKSAWKVCSWPLDLCKGDSNSFSLWRNGRGKKYPK